MNRRFVPHAFTLALVLGASTFRNAAAQATPVAGTVFEATSGLPVPNVEVRVLGTPRVARTDSVGKFLFSLDAGRYLFRATRLGLGPRSVVLDVVAGDTMTLGIEMDILPILLPEVAVKTKEEKYRGKMSGFAERMRTSPAPRSAFITRDEIERAQPRFVSDLLKARTGRAQCVGSATVWVDGAQMVSDKVGAPLRGVRTEPIQRDLRLDHFPPDEIEAIEVYVGAAQTPSEFSTTAMKGLSPGCTVVIWTR